MARGRSLRRALIAVAIVAVPVALSLAGLLAFKDRLKKQFPSLYSSIFLAYEHLSERTFLVDAPRLGLFLSKRDLAHFSDLYRKYEDPRFGHADYSARNRWRKAKLKYQGKLYDIRIRAHGRQPNGHRRGRYISFAVKLRRGEQLDGKRRFNLIIYERISSRADEIALLARTFGVLHQPEKLVRVKINDWSDKLYYLETRLDAAYTELMGRPSLRIDESANTASLVLASGAPPLEQLSRDLSDALQAQGLGPGHRRAIQQRYRDLNRVIKAGQSDQALRFFDLETAASFEAARLLGGMAGHGFVAGNLVLFLDTVNGKFAPALHRDNFPARLQPGDLAAQINDWRRDEGETLRLHLMHLLSQNDDIRQAAFRKLYQVIGSDAERRRLRAQLMTIKEFHNRELHWLSFVRRSSAEHEIVHNIEIVRRQLEAAAPRLMSGRHGDDLYMRVEPGSKAALEPSQWLLTGVGDAGPVLELFEQRGEALRLLRSSSLETTAEGELDLAGALQGQGFSDGLDANSSPQARRYWLRLRGLTAEVRAPALVRLRNSVTGAVIPVRGQPLPAAELGDFAEAAAALSPNAVEQAGDPIEVLRQSHPRLRLQLSAPAVVSIPAGEHHVDEDLLFPPGYALRIEAGATLLLGPEVLVLVRGQLDVDGTAEAPVRVHAEDPERPFGALAVLGGPGVSSRLRHLQLRHGSERWHQGAYFSGALSIYDVEKVVLQDCEISDNRADDGLNVKHAEVEIARCRFRRNHADAVDLDLSRGVVRDSSFEGNPDRDANGDGLDVSGAELLIEGCQMQGFRDKGLSIGERSHVVASRNTLRGNDVAVAVKDRSLALLVDNENDANRIDLSVYRKKKIFGGAEALVTEQPEQWRQDKASVDRVSRILTVPRARARQVAEALRADTSTLTAQLDQLRVEAAKEKAHR